jgi:hypothetical protein
MVTVGPNLYTPAKCCCYFDTLPAELFDITRPVKKQNATFDEEQTRMKHYNQEHGPGVVPN